MILRKKLLPRNVQDALVTLFMILIVPFVYWFELFIVMPTFFEPWSISYLFHILFGTFVLFNIASNFLAIIFCDTSIRGRMLPVGSNKNSHLCPVCETFVPVRSWHCNVCNICILKRDHHCMFTSCCIGHHNQRYFLMFIFYLFISTLYASVYNSLFIWSRIDFSTYTSFIKILFPLAAILMERSINQVYLFTYLIVIFGAVFTGVMLYFHVDLMLKGLVTHERDNVLNEYDLGKKRNVIEVLGVRWYLVWLTPFLESQLPHDGITWNTKVSTKGK